MSTPTAQLTSAAAYFSEAVCDCSQSLGRHAQTCLTIRLRRTPAHRQALADALAAHDRRTTRDTTDPVCLSCQQPVDPDNLCRVNGHPYHLGNCPQPHAADPHTYVTSHPRTGLSHRHRPDCPVLGDRGRPAATPTERALPVCAHCA